MNENIFLQDLTDEQKKVVFSQKNILLTAIPGSGKTRVITNKLVNDVVNNNTNEKFIAITYTRRASEEMRRRIVETFDEFPDNVWIGTIHSFCLEFILRKFASFSEYLSKGFTVLGEQDMENLREKVKNELGIEKQISFDWGLDKEGNPNEKHYIYSKAVKLYFTYLKEMKKVDFDFILYETYQLLIKNDNIKSNLYFQIRNFYIDEYQDTHSRQYDILKEIVTYRDSKKIGLLFVGDANQAIYSGLGGIAKSVQEIKEIFNRDFEEHHLTKCFRSNQKVIDFYSNFSVKTQVMTSSKTFNLQLPHVEVDISIHRDQLIERITNIISESLSLGYQENQICVVAPQWYLLYHLSNGLRKNLPNISFDSPAIVPLKKDEDNFIYKISKIILSDLSNQNIKMLQRISKEIIEQIKYELRQEFTLRPNDLINIINDCKKNLVEVNEGTEYLRIILSRVMEKINLLDDCKIQIDEFVKGTKDRIQKYENQGLEDDRIFFEKSLRSGKGIVVTTSHSVKGEEYDIMICYGILHGMIPHWNDIFNRRELSENMGKRLMFVIGSRARERVYFIAEQGRKTNNGYAYVPNNYLLNITGKMEFNGSFFTI